MRARFVIPASMISLFGILACGSLGTGATQPVPLRGVDTPTAGQPVIARKGIVAISQLTPMENVGAFPLFEWEAVPDAARYMLVLHTTAGRPYWAWGGAETSVYLGGGSELPPQESLGPSLFEPMTWTVFAFAADATLIGSSPARPISP